MPPHFGYELTEHAASVISEREIELAWLIRALTHPERVEPDRSQPELRHALLPIMERDNRVLRVVYNPFVDPLRIITCYFDRRQRGKT